MITKIFRVQIYPELRDKFEEKFADVSVRAVQGHAGFISVSITKSTRWSPDEYAMLSRWESEGAVSTFVGENWNQAVIPAGMEKFVKKCWVHHYESWD